MKKGCEREELRAGDVEQKYLAMHQLRRITWNLMLQKSIELK